MMVGSHNKLQSETGYIDARSHPPDRRNLLHRTAGPYIGSKGEELRVSTTSPLLSREPTSERTSVDFAFVPFPHSYGAANQASGLFDQLGGKHAQRRRHGEPERF